METSASVRSVFSKVLGCRSVREALEAEGLLVLSLGLVWFSPSRGTWSPLAIRSAMDFAVIAQESYESCCILWGLYAMAVPLE